MAAAGRLMRIGVGGAVLLAGSLVAGSPDRDPTRLQPGLFLYAAPGMQDPRFAESVVLLIEHAAEGSMGLVVNRPTDVPLRRALEKVEESPGSELPLHWGGPVQPEAIFALVRSRGAKLGNRPVLDDVQLTSEIAEVRSALAGPDPPGRVRVYSGYAGWGAGQLPAEVRAGGWVLDRADAASIFTPDPSRLWRRVHLILNRLDAHLEPGAATTPAALAGGLGAAE